MAATESSSATAANTKTLFAFKLILPPFLSF